MKANLGTTQSAVDAALEEMRRDDILKRIWRLDHTVWQPDPAEVANRLGWLRSAQTMAGEVENLQQFAADIHAAGFRDVVLLGMGGSSLAPELFSRTFGAESGGLRLQVLDSTDPGAVLALEASLDLSKTLFIVATKSGGTVETLSFFKYFYNRIVAEVGQTKAGGHFVAITDPGSKLQTLAKDLDFRAAFLNDPNIGGRYSVLSYFGLVPAALVGVDVARLLDSAQLASAACEAGDANADNLAVWLGVALGELAKAGRDKLTLVTSQAVASFADWVEQLVAESTGKHGKGILPIVGEPPGPPDLYGADRVFVHLRLAGDATHDADLAALEAAGQPVIRLELDDEYTLGAQFFVWEMATAVAGYRLGTNPFDQPNVEAAKMLARNLVRAYEASGELPRAEVAPTTAQDLFDFIAQAAPGDYVALQAFVPPTPETSTALHGLRMSIRKRTKLATTVGYGPRYLHSTGQLHKGDAGRGLFVVFTADDPTDAPIPDEAGSGEAALTFSVLKTAQALGDRQALADAGRHVIYFHLGEDTIGGLRILAG